MVHFHPVCSHHPFQPLIYFSLLKPGQCEGGNLLWALLEGASLRIQDQRIPHTHSRHHWARLGASLRGNQRPHRPGLVLAREQWSLLTTANTGQKAPSSSAKGRGRGTGRLVQLSLRFSHSSLFTPRPQTRAHVCQGAKSQSTGCAQSKLSLSLLGLTVQSPAPPL